MQLFAGQSDETFEQQGVQVGGRAKQEEIPSARFNKCFADQYAISGWVGAIDNVQVFGGAHRAGDILGGGVVGAISEYVNGEVIAASGAAEFGVLSEEGGGHGAFGDLVLSYEEVRGRSEGKHSGGQGDNGDQAGHCHDTENGIGDSDLSEFPSASCGVDPGEEVIEDYGQGQSSEGPVAGD